MMKRKFVMILIACVWQAGYGVAQEAPNVFSNAISGGVTQQAGGEQKFVNLFSGLPDLSIPLYNYKGKDGLSSGIVLRYNGGGIGVNELPGIAGLGWSLDCGGAVTRRLLGAPDDMAVNGYMYAPQIPADFSANASKYYYDTIDAQQDVFSFSCNAGSGEFYIGKDGSIVQKPETGLVIQYSTGSNGSIERFTIKDQSGTRYVFSERETNTISAPMLNAAMPTGNMGKSYTTAWLIKYIISSFVKDTIHFYYSPHNTRFKLSYPESNFVNEQTHVSEYIQKPTANSNTNSKRLDSIVTPENIRINFGYKYAYGGADCNKTKNQNVVVCGEYNPDSFTVITGIRIYDQQFIKGFDFTYEQGMRMSHNAQLLSQLTSYTDREAYMPYRFSYEPFYNLVLNDEDTTLNYLTSNATDYRGLYNGKKNKHQFVPVCDTCSGADRSFNFNYAKAHSLASVILPQGGTIRYIYESNDHAPYTASEQQVSITNNVYSTSNNINFTDLFSKRRVVQIRQNIDDIDKTAAAPLQSNTVLLCRITDVNNTNTVYASYNCSLNELFITGYAEWAFTVPDGNYKLVTSITSGSVTAGKQFIVRFLWENKATDLNYNATLCGGLRVKKILRTFEHMQDDLMELETNYRYVREDGRSSGFIGNKPSYSYPFRKIVKNGNITTIQDYNVFFGNGLNSFDNLQGAFAGYARVEEIDGPTDTTNGKTVYEFTDLNDAEANYGTEKAPYGPVMLNDWIPGLLRKVSVYDRNNVLLRNSTNKYQFIKNSYAGNLNFKNVKLLHGGTQQTVTGNTTVKQPLFTGEVYYPATGRTALTEAVDTVYDNNGNITTNYARFEYDPVYFNNQTRVTKSFDKTRGLEQETRLYYPYHYNIGGGIGRLRDSGIVTPVVLTEEWIKGDGNTRMTGGSLQDYTILPGGYVRPSGSYIFESVAPVPEATLGSFSGGALNRNAAYFKLASTISQYDGKGQPLQITDAVTGKSSSIIYDYNGRYKIAEAANALSTDIAYTSFESDGSGGWNIGSTNRDATVAVTGRRSYNIASGSLSKVGLNSGTMYSVSLWARPGANITVNGSSMVNSISTHNGWNLFQMRVTGISILTISGSGIIDEVRLHPDDAQMMTTAFNDKRMPMSHADANNTIIHTEYDNLQRVQFVRDMDNNILKKYGYSDTTLLIDTSAKWVTGIKILQYQPQVRWNYTGPCSYEYLYTDTNRYSATYRQQRWVYGGTDCCNTSASNYGPAYKYVNGVCEQGQRVNKRTSRKKNFPNPDTWLCVYYYLWSDGSESAEYTEENATPCVVSNPN